MRESKCMVYTSVYGNLSELVYNLVNEIKFNIILQGVVGEKKEMVCFLCLMAYQLSWVI